MSTLLEYFDEFFRLLRTMQPADIADILLVTFLVYKGIQLVRATSTARIAKAVVFLLLLAWATELLELHVLNFLLARVLELGLIALVVLFQPELRRAVEKVGSASLKEALSPKERNQEIHDVIVQTVTAAVNAENPLEGERLLLDLEFRRLDGMIGLHNFDDHALFGYAMKLQLLERQRTFRYEAGKRAFDELMAGIRQQVSSL